MLNVNQTIQAINNALSPFFIKDVGGDFFLSSYKSNNVFRLRVSNNCSSAFDSYGNEGEHVKVVKWFSDYWLFIEIRFSNPTAILLTLSIFQGNESDDDKQQLFRAEWDDYGDANLDHPQPHWHFLTNKAIEKTVVNFAEFMDDEEINDTFKDLLSEEKSKSIDLSGFHFAMNGDWTNTSVYQHRVKDETVLAKWLGGLMGYLKNELSYIDRKRKQHY